MREFAPSNSHVNAHVRDAIRGATTKVTISSAKELKAKALRMRVEAQDRMEPGMTTNLVADHAVPVAIICNEVRRLDNSTPEDIRDVVLRLTLIAVITVEEHKRLHANGFYRSMPPNWNHKNLIARYDTVGIELGPNKYLELLARAA